MVIVPVVPPENIYKWVLRQTTSIGAIMIATCADKHINIDARVIDENNCFTRWGRSYCPLDSYSRPNHIQLQKDWAVDYVGISWSLTSATPRVKQLIAYYKKLGIKIIVGGKHVEKVPEQALELGADVVAIGHAEHTIQKVLQAWQDDKPLNGIPGIAFKNGECVIKTNPESLTNLMSLPLPNFSLLKFARIKTYPISWWRGCPWNCEFCAVTEPVIWSPAECLMEQIKHLVRTYGMRHGFIVDDHFGGSLSKKKHYDEAMKFCRLCYEFQQQYGIKLSFAFQIRLDAAKYPELLQAMKKAGFDMACIGYESPIAEQLQAMDKKLRIASNTKNDLEIVTQKQMLEWTNVFKKLGFLIHGMFIFGYPLENDKELKHISIKEQINIYINFIKKTGIHTVQILLTVPLAGTKLQLRLKKEGKLLNIPDQYWDGQWLVYNAEPYNIQELQDAPRQIMTKIYRFKYIIHCVASVCIAFPLIVFPSVFSLVLLRVRHICGAFHIWRRHFFRNVSIRFVGVFIIWKWFNNFQKINYLEILKKAISLQQKNQNS